MWNGEGPRLERRVMTFEAAYLSPPVVHVALAMWDIADGSNQRVDISTDEVTETGFVIMFRTWGDTRVARVRASWLAIGAMRHEDDFDI